MEDIEKRLKDATDACLKAHGEWKDNQKDSSKREGLMEAVHEIRKVAARLEIMIAISERDQMASKPIPIPAHKSQQKRTKKSDDAKVDAANDGNSDKKRPSGGGGGTRRRRVSGGGDANGNS